MNKNILILGGNSPIVIQYIYSCLDKYKQTNFKIVIIDNHSTLRSNNQNIYHHFEYLFDDIIYYYNQSVTNDLLFLVMKKHNITHIINNIKLKPADNFARNFKRIINLNIDLLELIQLYPEIKLLINKHVFSSQEYNFRSYVNNEYSEQSLTNISNNLYYNLDSILTMYSDKVVKNICICEYTDYVISDQDYHTNKIIENYIFAYDKNIKPHVYSKAMNFTNAYDIINVWDNFTIVPIVDDDICKSNTFETRETIIKLESYGIHIKNELIPFLLYKMGKLDIFENEDFVFPNYTRIIFLDFMLNAIDTSLQKYNYII